LWRPGVGANFVAIFCNASVRLGTYPTVRDNLVIAMGDSGKSGYTMAMAGFLSGAVGYGLSTPFFLMKTRLQAEAGRVGADGILQTGARKGKRPQYRHMAHGFSEIIKNEGFLQLYRGGTALVIRGALLTAGQQLGYDGTKTFVKNKELMDDTPVLHVMASIIAGFMMSTFSAPADILMTRYQCAPMMGIRYKNLWHCAVSIAQKEGVATFYRGWWPFFLRVAPLNSLNMPAYEQVRRLLGLGYLD
jgi:hypothetical protein